MDVRAFLRARLGGFDRKSPSTLTEAAITARLAPGYFDALIDLATDSDDAVSSGATWLIRHELEAGRELPRAGIHRLVSGLGRITAWDAQLHLCQSVAMLGPGPDEADLLSDWLVPLLSHDRPFLRAWAADALCHLAGRTKSRPIDPDSLLERMGTDPAASVRARIKALRKAQARG